MPELTDDDIRLADWMATRLIRRWPSAKRYAADVRSVALAGAWKALRAWDPERGARSTYVTACARYAVLNFLEEQASQTRLGNVGRGVPLSDEGLEATDYAVTTLRPGHYEESVEAFSRLLRGLEKRVRLLMRLLYIEGYSHDEVAEVLGYRTRQAVSEAHRTALKHIRQSLEDIAC